MTLVALIGGIFIGAVLLLAWAMLATCKNDADR